MNYSYFTRKQANILYAATKRGELTIDRRTMSAIYDLVGDTSREVYAFRSKAEQAIGFLFKDRADLAQAVLDGKTVDLRPIATTFKPVGRLSNLDKLKDAGKWFEVNPLTGDTAPRGWSLRHVEGYVVVED